MSPLVRRIVRQRGRCNRSRKRDDQPNGDDEADHRHTEGVLAVIKPELPQARWVLDRTGGRSRLRRSWIKRELCARSQYRDHRPRLVAFGTTSPSRGKRARAKAAGEAAIFAGVYDLASITHTGGRIDRATSRALRSSAYLQKQRLTTPNYAGTATSETASSLDDKLMLTPIASVVRDSILQKSVAVLSRESSRLSNVAYSSHLEHVSILVSTLFNLDTSLLS